MRFIDLLKAAVRRDLQWEETRLPDWELQDPPRLDMLREPAPPEEPLLPAEQR